MDDQDREFVTKIAKDQSETRRRLDGVERRLDKIEKDGATPQAKGWENTFGQRVIQNIQSETTVGKFGFDISFEGGLQMEPSYRTRLSMQFVVDLEQLIKKYRLQSLHGRYQKIQNNQTQNNQSQIV